MVSFHADVVLLLRDDDKEKVATIDDFNFALPAVVDSVVVVPVRSETTIQHG
jgi:hypothetical protein